MSRALNPLDYGRPSPPPRELVPGLIRYSRLHLLTGREGSAKSFVALALAVAAAQGGRWLGLPTQRARVLVIDQENPTPDALERLYGLGARPEDQASLRVLSQQGVMLTDGASVAAVEREIGTFEPKLVVIDGAVSASGVDPNDNLAVAMLLGQLRQWANRFDLAVVALHHVPKASDDNDPDAALGAGAWRHQVDAHLHAAAARPHHEEAETGDGGRRDTYRYRWATSSKIRWGPKGLRQAFIVTSERAPDGALRWLRVEPEGELTRGRVASLGAPGERIVAALRVAAPLTRSELAQAVGMSPGGGGFKGALAKLLKGGRVITLEDGRITLGGHS